MQVKDIMTHDVIYVSSNTNISEVADMIFRNKFHAIPIVDENKVVGIITEDDFFLKGYNDMYLPSFIRSIAQNRVEDKIPQDIQDKMKKLLDAKASDLMTKEPTCVPPELPVSELMELIKKTRFTTFPVADRDNKILGIVTLVDVIGTVSDGSKELRKIISQHGEVRDIDKLVQAIHPYWRDTFVLMNKKKVQSWKGMVFISLVAAIVAIASLVFIVSSKNICNVEDENSAPNCVRFTYTSWSPCNENGIQTRQVLERFPQNCDGGTYPELTQKCQP